MNDVQINAQFYYLTMAKYIVSILSIFNPFISSFNFFISFLNNSDVIMKVLHFIDCHKSLEKFDSVKIAQF